MRVVVVSGHGLIGPGAPDAGGCGAGGCEADWTANLTDRITVALREAGHEAGGVEVGPSTARSKLADTIAPDLILYVHGDIGVPAVYYFPGSQPGRAMAEDLQEALCTVLPGLRLQAATPSGFPRAHDLLARTRAPAVLLELVDQRDVAGVEQLEAKLDAVARAVASGLAS